ncbi:hypothetical protein D3C73_1429650 [compost metagenome]
MGFRKAERPFESVTCIVELDFFRFAAVDILNDEHSAHIRVQLVILQLLPVARQKRSDFHIIATLIAFRGNRVHLELEIVVKNKINVDFVFGCAFNPQLPIPLGWS